MCGICPSRLTWCYDHLTLLGEDMPLCSQRLNVTALMCPCATQILIVLVVMLLGVDTDADFLNKRQHVSTIETRNSPSRSLLQHGAAAAYPGYCTLRNGGLPLHDLSNIAGKPVPVNNLSYSLHIIFHFILIKQYLLQ